MSPVPITEGATASASPPQQPRTLTDSPSAPPQSFDEIFQVKFYKILTDFRNNPKTSALTQKDRKSFIDTAYAATDEEFFGKRILSDYELKMRAMTRVFYKVLAEEPWSDDWIRPHDVERKLSRFEMHKDSVDLAAKHGIHTPREAVAAARNHLIKLSKLPEKERPGPRGPWDDIEVIYIPGTVSSTATNKIDRDTIYPVSASSVAAILHNHICREMTKPYEMAEKFVSCTDTEELVKLRQFACDVVDFAPHLLDNDNVSLLIVLLILARSEITRRFENNGIRIEGSTISHRRAECLKQKLGWMNADDRKPFDNVSTELQTRVKNACFPVPHGGSGGRLQPVRPKPPRKSSTPATPATPPTGYFSAPPLRMPTMAYSHSPGGPMPNYAPQATQAAPTNYAPTTYAPATQAPTTYAPTTPVPATPAPETPVPATQVPAAQVPTAQVPTAQVPTAQVPETEVPATKAATTGNGSSSNDPMDLS